MAPDVRSETLPSTVYRSLEKGQSLATPLPYTYVGTVHYDFAELPGHILYTGITSWKEMHKAETLPTCYASWSTWFTDQVTTHLVHNTTQWTVRDPDLRIQ